MPAIEELIKVPSLKFGIGDGYTIAENPHPLIWKCVVCNAPFSSNLWNYYIHFNTGAIENGIEFASLKDAESACNYRYREIITTLNKALPEPTMTAEFDSEVGATVVSPIDENEKAIRSAFALISSACQKLCKSSEIKFDAAKGCFYCSTKDGLFMMARVSFKGYLGTIEPYFELISALLLGYKNS